MIEPLTFQSGQPTLPIEPLKTTEKAFLHFEDTGLYSLTGENIVSPAWYFTSQQLEARNWKTRPDSNLSVNCYWIITLHHTLNVSLSSHLRAAMWAGIRAPSGIKFYHLFFNFPQALLWSNCQRWFQHFWEAEATASGFNRKCMYYRSAINLQWIAMLNSLRPSHLKLKAQVEF